MTVTPTSNLQAAINGLGTTGGTILFSPGTYTLTAPLKLPSGNMAMLTLSGYGATIKLNSAAPRFCDFNRTADYQTFAYFTVEGFQIDAGNVATEDHVIGFAYINGQVLQRINAHDITVKDVTAYNIAHANVAGAFRVGISISTYQRDRNEPTMNTIENIYVRNVKLEGGSAGFDVHGVDYSGSLPTAFGQTNIQIDNVSFDGCSWDSGVRGVTWTGDGILAGVGASCGRLYVNNCDFRGSGDNSIEVDGWDYALVTNCHSEDAFYVGYFMSNLGFPIHGIPGQQIIWRNCTSNNVALKTSNKAWCIGASSAANPVGALTLESGVATNGGNTNAGMWQRYHSAVAVNSANCTWNGKPYVAQ